MMMLDIRRMKEIGVYKLELCFELKYLSFISQKSSCYLHIRVKYFSELYTWLANDYAVFEYIICL